ncbi:hypothetical protein GGR51DRAFT_503218 [Nemania sp. FL0031]|nr:hypothetical protein GGR51DRAFT_503218 [Nemania sp. FL0031]
MDSPTQHTSTAQSLTPPAWPTADQATRSPKHDTDLHSHPVVLTLHSPSTRSLPASSLDQHAPSTSSESSTSLPSSARTADARECDICHELQSGVGQLIDHLASRHLETTSDPSRPYYCGREMCSKSKCKSLREFKRHLTRTAAHSQVAWHCCCGFRAHRKDSFWNHFKRMACTATKPYNYVCACGRFQVDSQQNNAFTIFKDHFTTCEKGQKGRPRRTSGPPSEG